MISLRVVVQLISNFFPFFILVFSKLPKLALLAFLCNFKWKLECIPVGCVQPARYCTGVSLTETPSRTETPLDRGPPGHRHPPGHRPPWTQTPRSCDLWCMLGQRPPCEENHRRLSKHNLPATSLRAVKMEIVAKQTNLKTNLDLSRAY